jgi:hypothetical protein
LKLYVCWGTFQYPWPGGHACGNAHDALVEAGWKPEVIRTFGLGQLPDVLNPTRRKVKELTGSQWVPVLETDDGEVIQDSKRIVEWARQNPAAGAERTGTGAPER